MLTAAGTIAIVAASARPGAAQTWQWQYITHPANGPTVAVQSTVVLSGDAIATSYTAPIANRQATIDACRVPLSDVRRAVVTERATASSFLVFELKPGRTASCEYSGQGSVAALPGDDIPLMRRIADTVNHALASTKVAAKPTAAPRRAQARVVAQATAAPEAATPKPTATPTASPSPTAKPSAKPTAKPTAKPIPEPTATPGVTIAHWVENDGLFTFIRVRNTGKAPVTITDGAVLDCKNVESGCGALGHHFLLDPFGTATIATLTSTTRASAFTYRLTATNGRETVVESGSASTEPPPRIAQMSQQEVRAAEAAALSALRGDGAPASTQQTFTPPRLVKRGSSRLAIGQTGTAQVRLMIGANGAPQQAEVVSTTNPHLVPAAIETAVSSTYAPATRNGQPVSAKYVATFSFDGEDPANADVPVWRRSPTPSP